MKRAFVWASLVLAAAVIVVIVLQLYFIAAWLFGASGALNAHKDTGFAVAHPLEILAFIAGLVGWWRNWRNVLWSFALPVIGTIQIFVVGDLKDPGNGWVHGLHGGLVLFVVGVAAAIVLREAEALGVWRTPRAGTVELKP